jgi:hypothetical protein
LRRRALREARLIIEMKLLQLREERLGCLRRALLERLPPDLWPEGPPPSAVKQSDAPVITILKSEDCTWVSMQSRRPSAAA